MLNLLTPILLFFFKYELCIGGNSVDVYYFYFFKFSEIYEFELKLEFNIGFELVIDFCGNESRFSRFFVYGLYEFKEVVLFTSIVVE
jgi:hypothetical protein